MPSATIEVPKFIPATDDLFVYGQAGGVAQQGATTMAMIQEFMRNNSDVLKCLVQSLWQPQVAYAVNQVVWSPNMPKNMLAIVTTAGTTNGSEPQWPSTAEQTIQDGTVIFEMRKQVYSSADFFNVDMVYPVGSIYMSTASTNPGTLFPGTTWEAYAQGRVLIGAGTGTDSRSERKTFAAGSTGGEYNHQLTVGELATHSHTGSATSASLTGTLNIPNGAAESSPAYYAATGIISASGNATKYGNANGGGAGGRVTVNATHSHSLTINNVGSNTKHNNIQPYITVYIWRRTA